MTDEQFKDLQSRMIIIQSMLGYALGIQQAEQVTAPTTEQAKQLNAMGLPPWPRISRKTNHFEIWQEGFKAQTAQLPQEETES